MPTWDLWNNDGFILFSVQIVNKLIKILINSWLSNEMNPKLQLSVAG